MSDEVVNDLFGLDQVEVLLAEPEPACLALLAIEPRSSERTDRRRPAPALVEAVTDRLRAVVRPYDRLEVLEDGTFAILVATLADLPTMERGISRLFDEVTAPYVMADAEVRVQALMGAGVRDPGEDPATFVARVAAGLETARSLDGQRPVIV